MPHSALLSFGVVMFVATLVALTLVYWGWTNRAAALRLQVAHRIGLDLAPPGADIARARRAQPWRWIQTELDHAGARGTPEELVAKVALWAVAGTLLTVWLLPGANKAVGLLAFAVPLLHLRHEARERSEQLTRQLPDALDRIGRTLRAGHAFSDALRLSADELPVPIAEEFARVSETHRLGIDLRDALGDLASRHPENFDLRLFVSAVLLHRDTGGNLVSILDHLAETIRERLIFQQKVASLTAETNVSALILGVLPFLLGCVLLLIRPGYLMPLVTTDLGRSMLLGAALSLAAGAVSMRWFARVEV